MAISQSSRFLFWPQGHPSHGQSQITLHFQALHSQPTRLHLAHLEEAQPPPILTFPASRPLRPFLAISAVKTITAKNAKVAQSTRSKSSHSKGKCAPLIFAYFAAFLRDLCGENAFKYARISQNGQSKSCDKGIQIPVAAYSLYKF